MIVNQEIKTGDILREIVHKAAQAAQHNVLATASTNYFVPANQ